MGRITFRVITFICTFLLEFHDTRYRHRDVFLVPIIREVSSYPASVHHACAKRRKNEERKKKKKKKRKKEKVSTKVQAPHRFG